MSVELLKKEMNNLSKGRIGDLFKMGIPNLDSIVDFSKYQLYNEGDVVCVYNLSDKSFNFYKCTVNNTMGELNLNNWNLHMVFYGGSGGKSGGVISKESLTVITEKDNTRDIDIPVMEFNPESNKIDMFVNGILYPSNRYTIKNKRIIINEDQIGFPKDKEITILLYSM